MRLTRFYLEDYQVIRDLEIRFGSSDEFKPLYALDFLVGVNGTGKSTVLRALVNIFLKLVSNQSLPEFRFDLEYEIEQPGTDAPRRIKISNREPALDYIVEDEDAPPPLRYASTAPSCWADAKIIAPDRSILPKRLVIFTTGSEIAWERLLEENRQPRPSAPSQYYQQLLNTEQASLEARARAKAEVPAEPTQLTMNLEAKSEPITRSVEDDFVAMARHNVLENIFIQEQPGKLSQALAQEADEEEWPILFIPSKQTALVSLCGILADLRDTTSTDQLRLKEVLSHLNIEGIPGFSLKFRLNSANATPNDREWVATLSKRASRAVQMGDDYLLVFDLADQQKDQAAKILQGLDSLAFFERLLEMAQPPRYEEAMLQEVNIFIQRSQVTSDQSKLTDEVPLLLFDWLSDGERSFLSRLSLFALLGSTESLILLDEPEVHFNDYWKRQIVHLIDQTVREQPSHVLIVSHSSITLTDVASDDILIVKNEDGYTRQAVNPAIPTFGGDPGDIMIHVFGAPTPTGAYSVDRILKAIEQKQPDQLRYLLGISGAGYWSYRLRRALDELELEQQSSQ